MRSLAPSIVAALTGFGFAYWVFTPPKNGAANPALSNASTLSGSANESTLARPPSLESSGANAQGITPFTGDLKKALNVADPFVAASRAMDWLKTATKEDFVRLAQDPKKFPFPHFNGFSEQFEIAYSDALVARWFELDPDALAAIRRIHLELKKASRYEADYLLNAAARVHPERILESVGDENKGFISTATATALSALASKDPGRARSYLDRFPENVRKYAEAAIVQGIAERDPLSAVSLAKALDPTLSTRIYMRAAESARRIGPGILRQVLSAVEGRIAGHTDFADWLLEYPEIAEDLKSSPTERPTALQLHIHDHLLDQADLVTPEQRARILEHFEKMPESTRGPLGAALAAAWARTQPKEAAEWAMSQAKSSDAGNPANHAAHYVFLRWIQTDRPTALAWFRTLPPSALRDSIGTNASTYFAEDGEMEAAMEICKPSGTAIDRNAIAHFTQIYAEKDPEAAANWLAQLLEAAVSADVVSTLMNAWMEKDIAPIGPWLESLADGPRRNTALSSFVQKIAFEDPSAGAAWVETINDPKLRQKAAASVYYGLSRQNPDRAREWISNLGGVDESWRGRFLRKIP